MKKISFTLLLACALTAQAQPSLKQGAQNLDAIVKAMTLEEKAQLLVGASIG